MSPVRSTPIPVSALLRQYLGSGAYTDCYSTEIAAAVSLEQYVTAFYTTPVFKLERQILKWSVSRPSTDDQARALARGTIDTFAAWHVESRRDDQLLLRDYQGRTRSWLMVAPRATDGSERTRLYFGSAVVPVRNPKAGTAELGSVVNALLGFHRIYSVVLLYAARSRLRAGRS